MAEDFFMPDLPVWVVEPRMTCVVTSEAETGEDGIGIVARRAVELIEPLSRLEKTIRARVDALLETASTPCNGT